jgi:hypothetical protein
MRRQTLLLAADPLGLVACHRDNDGLRLLASFPAGEHAAFSAWLGGRAPGEPCRMLVNLPDEAYEVEDLPRVRGADRRALLARRLAAWFPDPRYALAIPLGRAPDGRKAFERVLFAGLERSADLQAWIDALGVHGGQLERLIPSAALLPRLSALSPLHGSRSAAPRLVAAAGRAGLRITLLSGRQAVFSRLIAIPEGSAATTLAFQAEIERTRSYLISQRRLSADAPVPILILDGEAGQPGALPLQPVPFVGNEDARLTAVDAALLLALGQADSRIGWPGDTAPRRWPRLPERRILAATGLASLAVLGAAAWAEQQAQAAAEATAAAERARAAQAAALAAEVAERAALEARRPQPAEPAPEPPPAAPEPPVPCPSPATPPAPTLARIDGMLRRPDGETLLWIEGAWVRAHTLGLHAATGPSAALTAAGHRVTVRVGDSWAIPGTTATSAASQADTAPAIDTKEHP